MEKTIIVGEGLPVCGLCGTCYQPCENDPELGICECGRMVDLGSHAETIERELFGDEDLSDYT